MIRLRLMFFLSVIMRTWTRECFTLLKYLAPSSGGLVEPPNIDAYS